MYIPPKMQVHIEKVFAGEYEVNFHSAEPIIVDIGANVGAFARWASARWANSRIFCFEPIKSNFDMLKRNTADMPNISCFNAAVGSSERTQMMFYGKNNEGEASMFQGVQQSEDGEEVKVIAASELMNCHILKIDTEGAEVEILENMTIEPIVIMLEYHSEQNRLRVQEILGKKYSLIGSESKALNYGIAKYALTSAIKK